MAMHPGGHRAVVVGGVRTVIKAVAAGSPSVRSNDEHAGDIVLLDAPIPDGGIPFDWSLVGDLITKDRILLRQAYGATTSLKPSCGCGPGVLMPPPASKPSLLTRTRTRSLDSWPRRAPPSTDPA